MRSLPVALLCAGTLALAPLPAWAHGGEDHAAPAQPSSSASGATRAVAAETDAFSVVVKYPTRGGGPLHARIYVARAETSEPVAGAAVRLELKGGVEAKVDARPTDSPGIYEAVLGAPPDGAQASGIASIQAGDAFDLVVLGDLRFGPDASRDAPAPASPPGAPAWAMAAGAALLAALAATGGFALGRRRRSPPPQAEGVRS